MHWKYTYVISSIDIDIDHIPGCMPLRIPGAVSDMVTQLLILQITSGLSLVNVILLEICKDDWYWLPEVFSL